MTVTNVYIQYRPAVNVVVGVAVAVFGTLNNK